MSAEATLRSDIEAAFGERVVGVTQLAGGDINDAYAVDLADGARLFVKTRADVLPAMYEREAEGLRFLAEARALRIPEVRIATDRLLALEFIRSAPRARDFEERLARGLAALHQSGADAFGFAHDNYVGSLPQANTPRARWAEFYRDARLVPLLTRAAPTLPAGLRRDLDGILARLDALVGPEESPARLHGDLWTGNVITDEHGAPVLVDPAVYGGHREIDLAMYQLFGSPSPRFFAAYDELVPRAPGAEERVPLYQLYPLLVHVCLFGAGYVSLLARTVAALR